MYTYIGIIQGNTKYKHTSIHNAHTFHLMYIKDLYQEYFFFVYGKKCHYLYHQYGFKLIGENTNKYIITHVKDGCRNDLFVISTIFL